MTDKKVFQFMVGAVSIALIGLGVKMIVFPNRDKLVLRIKKYRPNWDSSVMNTWDYGFLWNLHRALGKGEQSFEYKGKSYSTETGKAI
jgi:hypothetical protein